MVAIPQGTGLIGGVEKRKIEVVDYDPEWVKKFEVHKKKIVDAVGKNVVSIEHIGSTSVPGLSAKPIIDILLVVEDSGDEDSYMSQMLNAGYELRVREPDFYEHRMLRTPEKDVHIHVFSIGCIEIDKYLTFRNRLRSSEEDRKQYEDLKKSLAEKDWDDMNAYSSAKTNLIDKIIADATNNH